MTTFAIAALPRCDWDDLAASVEPMTGWCWAGHDGLVAATQPPPETVPTGWIWAWAAADRWARWRVDPSAGCVGAELRTGLPGPGAETAILRGARSPLLPVRSDAATPRWAPGARPVEGFRLLAVVSPVVATFVDFAWATSP